MSICEVCGFKVGHAISCCQKYTNQIPYGKETISDWAKHLEHCPGCGVAAEGYHHKNCDVEECPDSHSRVISCKCLICTN